MEKFIDLKQDVLNFIKENDVYETKPNINVNFDSLRRKKDLFINRRIPNRDGDDGLIDVWNIDTIFTENAKKFLTEYTTKVKNTISVAFETQYEIKTHNLYINKSVSETRGIHADSHFFPSRVKSFLFLTDVPDRSFGPFSFIKGSHTGRGLKYHRKYDIYEPLNQEDKENYQIFENVSEGDLVIAAVAGAHRGLPQLEGRERMVIVTSYDPIV